MRRIGWTLALLCLVAAPAAAQIPDEFTNLKVFPADIGKRDLVEAMRGFSTALGVRCEHCHVEKEGTEETDFASDDLEPKRVARAMMKMVGEINDKLLPTTGRDSLIRVRCVTCHRGIQRPEQIDDVLAAAAESDGAQGAIARYDALREEHYGDGSYDFSSRTLAGLAEHLAREAGDVDGAIAVIEHGIELDPQTAYNHVMLGQLQMQKGDREAALASLARALELEPDNRYAKRMLERIRGEE